MPSSRSTEVFGFGANYYRNMGQATKKTMAHSPEEEMKVYTFDETPWESEDDSIDQVSCSASASFFLTDKGKIYTCGTMHGKVRPKLTRKVIQLPLKCAQIATGRHFVLARMEGGLAVCSWGAGHFGQLGLGNDSAPCIDQPTVIESLLPHVVGSPVASVAAGYWHAMAVTASGQLYSWGCNRNAQCGMKPQRDPPTICLPNLVRFDGDPRQITKVAAGRSHSVALDTNGAVYCWGACQYGQCGQVSRRRGGIAPPKHVEALAQVTIADIAAGDSHTLALTGGGRLFGWGGGYEGQLGLGAILQLNPKPKLIGDLDFVAIQAGQQTQQKLMNGDDNDSGIATNLSQIPRIVSIHATGNTSIAISSSGHAYSWGCNDVGSIGIPTPKNKDDLTFAEPGTPLPKTSSLRQLHTISFDSTHNVALPVRIDSLSHVHIKSVSGSPTFTWFVAKQRKPGKEEAVFGRTLYEIQEGKRSGIVSPTNNTKNNSRNNNSKTETISGSNGKAPRSPKSDKASVSADMETSITASTATTAPQSTKSIASDRTPEAPDSVSSMPVDPPEVIEGLEGKFGAATIASGASSPSKPASQGDFFSKSERGYFNTGGGSSSKPPKSPTKRSTTARIDEMSPSPTKSKRSFSLKKLGKMVRRASLGSRKGGSSNPDD